MKKLNQNINKTSAAQFAGIAIYVTPEIVTWLEGATQGILHLSIYRDLLFSMATSDMSIEKRGIDVPLKPLEVEASANGLGERWKLGRKVMTRLLKEMEQLGLIKLSRSKLTSIATMTAVREYDAIAPVSSNPPSTGSQAEQQDAAQPSSDDGASEAQPIISSEAHRDDGTAAPCVAADPSPQASASTDDVVSTDPIHMPDDRQHTYTQTTLFDGEDELPESAQGA